MTQDLRIEEYWSLATAHIDADAGWKAKEVLLAILLLSPADARAHLELAKIYQADGKLIEALVHASFADTIDPTLPTLPVTLGELFYVAGMYDRSRTYLGQAVRSGEKRRSVIEKLAKCKSFQVRMVPSNSTD